MARETAVRVGFLLVQVTTLVTDASGREYHTDRLRGPRWFEGMSVVMVRTVKGESPRPMAFEGGLT